MVFPDDRPVLGLNALVGHTRAHDFGQTINVDCINPQLGLDFLAHALAPGFGAKNADLERDVFGGNAHALELFSDH